MKLSKFLRQNSRVLLMVFMSLLLVAFLIPNTIQGISGREGAENFKLGQAYGKDIMTDDVRKLSEEFRSLARYGLTPNVPDSAMLEFYLLTEEARRLGVRVSRDEAKADLARRGVSDDFLRAIQKATQRNYDAIYDICGRWMAVERLAELQAAALVDSLPRQELAFRDRAQDAVAQMSVLDAKAFVNLVPEPTDEELRAFFDEAKGRATNHTMDKIEFGYLLPDRVQVEFLTVDPLKVRNNKSFTIQTGQVLKYFEENSKRYLKPDPTASQPAGGRPAQVPMTFEEAKDRVREDYRQAHAVEVAASLVNDIYSEAHRPWSMSTREEDGFYRPPVEAPSFEELKQRFSVSYEVESGQAELAGAEALAKIPGIGRASINLGPQATVPFSDLALRVKGLLDKDPGDGRPIMNVAEPAPVVLTSRLSMEGGKAVSNPYQAYVFRVVKVAPSAPAESIEGIREQVVQDWKLVRANELARQKAEALAARAREVGLKTAAEEATELKALLSSADVAASQPATSAPAAQPSRYVQNFEPFAPSGLTRGSKTVMRVGNAPNLIEAIYKLGDEPAVEGGPKRVAVVANIDKANGHFRWVACQLDEIHPVYEETFASQLAAAVSGAERTAHDEFVRDWVSPEAVKMRAGFAPEIATTPEKARKP